MSLNIAATALMTNQSVLSVIGNNIANANTVGYSRQTAQLQQVAGQKIGSGYFGRGVQLADVSRAYDSFLTRQANSTQTVASADAVRLQKIQQVEALFPLGTGSIGEQLNKSLNAWTDLKASPSDSTARGVVINTSDELAARIRDTSSRLQEIRDTTRLQTAETIDSINQMADQIAALNQRIAGLVSSNQVPNDLMDQRDQVIAELNKKIQVTTVDPGDGTLSVFVASSMPLVLAGDAAKLRLDRSDVDSANRQVISFVRGASATSLQDSMLIGGELKGLQDFVNTDLTQTQSDLGRLALALATEVNQQHRSGLDLNGNAGGNFFSIGALVGHAAISNTGTATLGITVSDGTALKPTDYEVTYTAPGTVSVRRLSDGQSVTLTPAAGTLPVTFDGLTLSQTGGAAAVGDSYLLRPGADAAQNIAMALASPAEVAVASRLTVTPTSTNSGNSTIESVALTLQTGTLPATVPSFTLTYNSATSQFTIPAPALPATITPSTLSYTPGQPMTFTYSDGAGNSFAYNLTLRGQPANTDSFALSQTTAAAVRFNSGNAVSMLALRDQQTFDGTTTLSDAYVPVFSSLGARIDNAKFAAEFSLAQATSAETQRANNAGVNLDEEAAKLIQYQQAYQASARYMQTAQGLFDSLLAAFN